MPSKIWTDGATMRIRTLFSKAGPTQPDTWPVIIVGGGLASPGGDRPLLSWACCGSHPGIVFEGRI